MNPQTAHLLILDDDATLATAVGRLLETRGYSSAVFSDPFAALAAVRETPARFHAVLTDLTMPAMSGEQFIAALRALVPGLPVIVSTGRAYAFDEAARALLGVTEVLLKPWRLDEAIDALARSLVHLHGEHAVGAH